MEQLAMMGEGTSLEGAVYFREDDVLVRSADLSKPLIRYALPDEGDGALLSHLQPFDRYQVCLVRDDPIDTAGSWEKHVQNLVTAAKWNCPDVAVSTRSLSTVSLSAEGKSYTVSAEGEGADEIFAWIEFSLMDDPLAHRLITASDGMALADGDQPCKFTFYDAKMLGKPTDSMKLTLEVCTVDDAPAALFVELQSDDGTIQIELTALGSGEETAQ